jgi:hypothetical protein
VRRFKLYSVKPSHKAPWQQQTPSGPAVQSSVHLTRPPPPGGRCARASTWSDLRSADLDSNELEGDLSGFAQLPKLTVLIMHNLRLAGTLPQQLCKVYECDARDNHWQCPLPWAHALPRNASRNGSNCCLVDKCTNGSAMRQPRSTVGDVQGAAARYLVEARRTAQDVRSLTLLSPCQAMYCPIQRAAGAVPLSLSKLLRCLNARSRRSLPLPYPATSLTRSSRRLFTHHVSITKNTVDAITRKQTFIWHYSQLHISLQPSRCCGCFCV